MSTRHLNSFSLGGLYLLDVRGLPCTRSGLRHQFAGVWGLGFLSIPQGRFKGLLNRVWSLLRMSFTSDSGMRAGARARGRVHVAATLFYFQLHHFLTIVRFMPLEQNGAV